MITVFSNEHEGHCGLLEAQGDAFVASAECPERAIDVIHAIRDAAFGEMRAPRSFGDEKITAVHSRAYLKFLEHAHDRWLRIDGASEAVTPNIHPDSRAAGYPASVVAQAGFHMSDASAPITGGTWSSACCSAWTAAHAASLVLAGEPRAYALCRPPGHHAFSDMAGGFCYLNNTAIAAQMLRGAYDRVAILDVDLHHGNGTQSIFYVRNDVLTVSIHADPERFYPFFWGYAGEQGKDAGLGYNLNLPLPRGSGDTEFLSALEVAIERIRAFAPGALVIALGLDAFEGDPFGGLRVSTPGFRGIAASIASGLRLPTLIVQEGGYLCDELGENLNQFLQGLQDV